MRDCGLSDSGVRELADGLPELRSLNLEHCTKARRLRGPLASACRAVSCGPACRLKHAHLTAMPRRCDDHQM